MSEHLQILVTGGAGYLGSIMVPALLAAGHVVTVLDNFMFRQNSLNHVCADQNFAVVKGDVRDDRLMRELLGSADVVIPLAALVGAPLCQQDPVAATTVNLEAPKAMLKAMSPAQRLLIPITNSGYGVGESDKFCTEATPMRPLSRYGIHKVEVEKMVLDRGNAISFRLATVFGMSPRMRLDLLVNDLVHRAVTDRFVVLFEGHFRRNYIHVRDVTRVFVHGLRQFRYYEEPAVQRGPVRRQPVEDGTVRAHPPPLAWLRPHGGPGGRGSRQARLHRLERETGADRLRTGALAGFRHRRTDQGMRHAA